MIGLVAPLPLAVIAALVLGGSIEHLTTQRFRWWPFAVAAFAVQLPLYSPPFNSWPPLVGFGIPLGLISMAIVMLVLLRNALQPLSPGLLLAGLGIGLNLTVMLANGGWMPRASDGPVGLFEHGDQQSSIVNTIPSGPETRLSWLGDFLVQPSWFPLANQVSGGDLLLSFGIAAWAFTATRPDRFRRS